MGDAWKTARRLRIAGRVMAVIAIPVGIAIVTLMIHIIHMVEMIGDTTGRP
jgi:hypothetical protein